MNARFLHPRRKVVASWRRVIAYAYAPERVFARFRYQVEATYVNRLRRQRASSPGLTSNAAWRLPATSSAGSESVSDYRAAFWRAAWPALRRLQIEPIFGMGFVAWHLIQFTQKAFGGRQNASSYTAKQSSTEA